MKLLSALFLCVTFSGTAQTTAGKVLEKYSGQYQIADSDNRFPRIDLGSGTSWYFAVEAQDGSSVLSLCSSRDTSVIKYEPITGTPTVTVWEETGEVLDVLIYDGIPVKKSDVKGPVYILKYFDKCISDTATFVFYSPDAFALRTYKIDGRMVRYMKKM